MLLYTVTEIDKRIPIENVLFHWFLTGNSSFIIPNS